MKIYYLSSSAFSDNQMSLLRYLGKQFDITYAVIIPAINSNYTREELAVFCQEQGIRFEPIELRQRFRDPRVIRSYISILQSIRNAKPDIIYIANFDQLYLNALLLLLDRSKTIVGLHDVENHSKTAFSFLAGLGKKILISNFRHFHTYSAIQQKLLQSKIPGKAVHNISLPLINFGPLPLRAAKKAETCFLFFGNILFYKGLDLLLKAFRNVATGHPGARLVIAGRCTNWGEQYAALTEGVPKIETHIRFIDNSEIPGFFAQADYVVLPYRDTTQSGPLMIAYNYNVPVLVSKAEGFSEFTQEDTTGYSYDLYRPGDLEKVLEDCIDRPAETYDALKKRLALYTEANFSMTAITKKYGQMFRSL